MDYASTYRRQRTWVNAGLARSLTGGVHAQGPGWRQASSSSSRPVPRVEQGRQQRRRAPGPGQLRPTPARARPPASAGGRAAPAPVQGSHREGEGRRRQEEAGGGSGGRAAMERAAPATLGQGAGTGVFRTEHRIHSEAKEAPESGGEAVRRGDRGGYRELGRWRYSVKQGLQRWGKGLGQLVETWGGRWTSPEQERDARLAGTKKKTGRPRRTEANSGEMPMLRWSGRLGEGLGRCGRGRGSLYRPRGRLWSSRTSSRPSINGGQWLGMARAWHLRRIHGEQRRDRSTVRCRGSRGSY